jgi:hypothetical protein
MWPNGAELPLEDFPSTQARSIRLDRVGGGVGPDAVEAVPQCLRCGSAIRDDLVAHVLWDLL